MRGLLLVESPRSLAVFDSEVIFNVRISTQRFSILIELNHYGICIRKIRRRQLPVFRDIRVMPQLGSRLVRVTCHKPSLDAAGLMRIASILASRVFMSLRLRVGIAFASVQPYDKERASPQVFRLDEINARERVVNRRDQHRLKL